MIVFKETADVDLDQLAALRLAVGFSVRTTERIAQEVAGARWVVHAWSDHLLVGFARAISDGVSNAYITSVMVDGRFRRQGIAREMLRRLMQDRPDIRFVLHSRKDAIPFYRALGFQDLCDVMYRDRTG